jgi:hypothetical protein
MPKMDSCTKALEANAAPEHLDDLRAFRLTDIHQAHRAGAPAVHPSVNFFDPIRGLTVELELLIS